MDKAARLSQLSPFKICLCILLHESLTNNTLCPGLKPKLQAMLLREIHNKKAEEPTLNQLL